MEYRKREYKNTTNRDTIQADMENNQAGIKITQHICIFSNDIQGKTMYMEKKNIENLTDKGRGT